MTTVPVTLEPDFIEAHNEARRLLCAPGTWWAGEQRLALGGRAREGLAQRHQPPWMRELSDVDLPDTAVEAVDKLVFDAGNIDRALVDGWVSELGAERYVELVSVVAVVAMLDVYAEGLGLAPTALGTPEAGEPSRERPDGLGDIGAYVPMLEPFPFANVARALSLVPSANHHFRLVMVDMYAGGAFGESVWDRPLSRPQAELLATRVAALNECFY